jgi:hypothetical protein
MESKMKKIRSKQVIRVDAHKAGYPYYKIVIGEEDFQELGFTVHPNESGIIVQSIYGADRLAISTIDSGAVSISAALPSKTSSFAAESEEKVAR